MDEYYIQYKDQSYDDDGSLEEYWEFFTDKNERVLKFDSETHAKKQIEYFMRNAGNAGSYYWLDESYETRVIKMKSV